MGATAEQRLEIAKDGARISAHPDAVGRVAGDQAWPVSRGKLSELALRDLQRHLCGGRVLASGGDSARVLIGSFDARGQRTFGGARLREQILKRADIEP